MNLTNQIRSTNALDSEPSETLRVLVIADSKSTAQQYKDALGNVGIQTESECDPSKTHDLIRSFDPDLVLVDGGKSAFSGLELATDVRENPDWENIALILLGNEDDPGFRLTGLKQGVDDCLDKTVHPGELVEIVQLRAKRARRIRCRDAECLLAQSERDIWHTAVDQHDIVSIADETGTITYVNEKFCEVSGYNTEELIGRNHNILNSGFHPGNYFSDLWRTISRGGIWHGEICNRRKDGGHYWVISTIIPFMDASGRPYQYVSLRTDITDLKANEGRLQRSQKFADIGTWDWNIETGDLYWSERIGPLFGYAESELETSYENFLAAVHPEDRQSLTDAVDACVLHSADYNIEHRVVWPDGTVRWLLERGDVVRASDGRPLHMLGVVQDITESRAIRESLASSKEEAESANRAKSQFLSSMSHELRTPLNAILGFAQLLEIEALTTDQRDSVEEIGKAGHHLLELINEVLDLAKIEAGHVDLSMEGVELPTLFQECRPLIKPFLDKYQISLKYQPETCEYLAVHADFTRLKQALLNLLTNACKYNQPGGAVTIECAIVKDDWIRISVRDTGSGISAELQAGLFQPFSRLGAENSDIEGTGIGLVITRQLVELMGGRIGVDSQIDAGSTFWIELPLDKRSGDPKVDPSREAVGLQSNTGHLYTVLYVEDNPANLRLVSRFLGRRPEIHLLTAHEPQLGLKLAETRQPDLILLDINLPGMDGYELLARLRAKQAGCSVPVLAISANAMPVDVQRGLDAGFDAYLTKPLDISDFFSELDKHLAARGTSK